MSKHVLRKRVKEVLFNPRVRPSLRAAGPPHVQSARPTCATAPPTAPSCMGYVSEPGERAITRRVIEALLSNFRIAGLTLRSPSRRIGGRPNLPIIPSALASLAPAWQRCESMFTHCAHRFFCSSEPPRRMVTGDALVWFGGVCITSSVAALWCWSVCDACVLLTRRLGVSPNILLTPSSAS